MDLRFYRDFQLIIYPLYIINAISFLLINQLNKRDIKQNKTKQYERHFEIQSTYSTVPLHGGGGD
jgi:hypothetical protein